MITFIATGLNLNTNKPAFKSFKTASIMKMKSLVSELLDSDFFVEDWTMTRKLPRADRWGSNIDWTMGASGINSSAILFEAMEEK